MGRNPPPPRKANMGARVSSMEGVTIQPLGKPASATCDGCGAPTQTTAANCNHCGRPVRFDLEGVSRMTAEQLEKTKQEFFRRYGIPKSIIDGTTSGGPG